MTDQPTQDYYLARIAAERAAAESAASDDARRVHLKLAEEYQRIVDGKQPRPSATE